MDFGGVEMIVKDIDSRLIITKFAMHGYNIHPSAVELLKGMKEDIDGIIAEICRTANGCFIITPEEIKPIISKFKVKTVSPVQSIQPKSEAEMAKEEIKKVKSAEVREVSVLKDITGKSSCRGTVEDFVVYFNSRLEKISRILKPRLKAIPISAIGKVRTQDIDVIGIVNEVREVNQNTAIFELEDRTGIVSVVATGKIKEIAMELMGDEVIGVSGTIRGGRSIMAERIVFPDIPNGSKTIKKDFAIAFISDAHFGSNTFLEKEWEMFLKWLNGEIGEGSEKVKYLVVAGDVVDGVGVYPGQEHELTIFDIYEQYEEAASQLDRVPDHIKIILAPGNHDAVRQAEPQPCLPKEFSDLFGKNVTHVGNPSLLDLDGLKLLIYHGRSLDDLMAKIPRLNYERPHEALYELLKRRHLAPMYGQRSPIAPEREDYLVIDEVPDILHTGHVHTYGVGFYRGVFCINSSTWQSQTEFQKKVNLNPMPGKVAVYQPGGNVMRLNFYNN
jgi:DNA polymerase II small subunit